jgi:protocatechuate 3,4-dioxygenase beta subunit
LAISLLRYAAVSISIYLMIFISSCSTVLENNLADHPETGNSLSTCQQTRPDMLGPFYEPGAPVRDRVGEGYVLEGTVLSAVDCSPIAGAQIEFWMAGPDAVYTDDYRAIVYSLEDGTYKFESHSPPPYSGRPPHIHLRVTTAGYKELVTQHYPKEGSSQAEFELVLVPE